MRQADKRRQRNAAVKSRLRTLLKRTRAAIEAKDEAQIAQLLPQTISYLDKAATKGVIHWRNAARRKSELTRKRGGSARPAATVSQSEQ